MIEAIKRGDHSTWALLVTKHQNRVYATCVKMVHDRELALDLAQESFVKLMVGIGSFDGRAKFTTWLTRIVMNVCLSKLRSEKLRRHASLDAPSGGADGRGDGSDGDARPGRGTELEQAREPSLSSRVEAHEDRERVLSALRNLDPDQRAVLMLCDAQGHSYEQIAETLGVAVGTVKSRLFRARAALRAEVEALGKNSHGANPISTPMPKSSRRS